MAERPRLQGDLTARGSGYSAPTLGLSGLDTLSFRRPRGWSILGRPFARDEDAFRVAMPPV
jgi:hypothetical protein